MEVEAAEKGAPWAPRTLKRPRAPKTKGRNLQCEHCPFVGNFHSDLEDHKVVHTGKKLFVCSCGQACSTEGSLKRHEASAHSGIKPYVCVPCNRSFARPDVLASHRKGKRHVLKARPFVCDTCDERFGDDELLQAHLQGMHGAFQCVTCRARFATEDALRVHLPEDGAHECATCGLRFRTEDALRWHDLGMHKKDLRERWR